MTKLTLQIRIVVSVMILPMILFSGCATTSREKRPMTAFKYGDNYPLIRKALGLRCYLFFFKDTNGNFYSCDKVFVAATGKNYLMLAKNQRLYSVINRKDLVNFSSFNGESAHTGKLPHEGGFKNLLDPFVPPRPLNQKDFITPDQKALDSIKLGNSQVLGHMIAFAPFVPMALLSMNLENNKHDDDLKLFEDLKLGMSYEEVTKLLGDPDFAKGNPANYGVTSYHQRQWSMGFRANNLTWFRSGIDVLRGYRTRL
ncbi:MAG: hypothetical protein L3J39_02655 [Verrucomicrobiales bacterium]|nr:hypothetical protein [Verrucomicrobiales bacterium]